MNKIDPNELRRRFEGFFVKRFADHAKKNGGEISDIASLKPGSSSLVPHDDPSTLFTSAGMHQFKDDFTGNLRDRNGHKTRAAVTIQKCMRTPDLENVGKTARHHTFFEMLGFFSFGDGLKAENGSVGFFKKEAIRWIWDFYTLPESEGGCGLDKSKMYVSVYGGDENGDGRDEGAAKIWKPLLKGLKGKRIFYLDEHDNFWPAGAPSQGPNGVCGPCSEIFYDLGEKYGEGNVETNDDRFMEIGNIVFTQFERSGPTTGKGVLTPLPQKNIDFGGGFERLVMVLEDVGTTLDTSLFMPIREWLRTEMAEKVAIFYPSTHELSVSVERSRRFDGLTGYALASHSWDRPTGEKNSTFFQSLGGWKELLRKGKERGPLWLESLGSIEKAHFYVLDCLTREKRIADHVRAAVFCIADGVSPGKEKAEYIIRRIVRRAFRDGKALGFDGPFLHKLVPIIVEQYGDAYPLLKQNPAGLAGILEAEEKHFAQTLERGLQLLGAAIDKADSSKPFSGKIAFDLYQSAGLPVDVVRDELAASEMTLDEAGYIKAEEDHIKASSAGGKAALFDKGWFNEVKSGATITQFTGYENDSDTGQIVGIGLGDELADSIKAGDKATIVLDITPFYAESGGQTGDTGRLVGENGVFEVFDTKKRDDYFLHIGKVIEGEIKSGEQITANVDAAKRAATKANHSATHLMHAALRNVLGEHVLQKGSEVGPERLRFDFSHGQGVSFEERQQIERQVNEEIQANTEIVTDVMTPEDAQNAGAMTLFGEKYGDKVRVLSMGRSIGVSPIRSDVRPAHQPTDGTSVGTHGQDTHATQFGVNDSHVKKRQGARLPHWEAEGVTYFVTFRLADSIPEKARENILLERQNIVASAEKTGREYSKSERKRLAILYTEAVDEILANGHGECVLAREDCGTVVANALRHFDGERYELFAWCVMPNHVHVVFAPKDDHKLPEIINSWKSFTAKECNRIIGKTGKFWQGESFDRIVRDPSEFEKFVTYTVENPEKAGLKDWPLFWPTDRSIGVSPIRSDVRPAHQPTDETSVGTHGQDTHATRCYSTELCGGTHASRTGDIGLFKITHEGSSSAGVRRIEAVTGLAALKIVENESVILARLHAATKAQPGKLESKIEGLIKEVKDLKSQAKKSGGGVDAKVLETIKANAQTIGETKVYVHDVKNVDAAELLTISEALGQDSASSAILLGSSGQGRALLLLAFSKDLLGRGLHAGKIIGEIARLVGGGGGGKPQQAQAGGKNPEGMSEALKLGNQRIEEALNS